MSIYSEWYKSIQTAEKSCINQNNIKKIHYKFQDGREMVEEYNLETCVLLRRAWKPKNEIGNEGKWEVEVGDPLPIIESVENVGIKERDDQPQIMKRNTRINIEWRIRNLPYPLNNYVVTVEEKEKCILVKTLNKKYYKKLFVLELIRLNLPIEQSNLQISHKYNTLFVQYKKPEMLMNFEKAWWEEIKRIAPRDFCGDSKEIPDECKPS